MVEKSNEGVMLLITTMLLELHKHDLSHNNLQQCSQYAMSIPVRASSI